MNIIRKNSKRGRSREGRMGETKIDIVVGERWVG